MDDDVIKQAIYANQMQIHEINQKDVILKALTDEFWELQTAAAKHMFKPNKTEEEQQEYENVMKLLKENLAKCKKRYKELDMDYQGRTPGVCPDCKGTGKRKVFRTTPDGYMVVRFENCDCYNTIYKSKIYDKSALRQYDDFDITKYEQTDIKTMVTFIQGIKNGKIEKPILYIVGPTGSGKTYLANNIGNEAVKHLIKTKFITAPVMFNKLMELKSDDLVEADRFRKDLHKIDLLILDDLGAEIFTESKREELFNLIENRLADKKPMIITSNLTPELIKEKYGERIYSRIFGNSMNILIKNGDLRLKK